MAGFTIYQLARLMSGDKNKENYIPPQGSAPLILIYGAFFFRISSYFIVRRQDNIFMIVSSILGSAKWIDRALHHFHKALLNTYI